VASEINVEEMFESNYQQFQVNASIDPNAESDSG